MLLALSITASLAASDRSRCLSGDTDACDRERSRVALRWARGVVGHGPQEPWRPHELYRLHPEAVRREAMRDSDEAKGALLSNVGAELTACILYEDCSAYEGSELRTHLAEPPEGPIEVDTTWTAPQTLLVTQHLGHGIEGVPQSSDRQPDVHDPSVWMALAEMGPPLGEVPLDAGGHASVPVDLLTSTDTWPRVIHGKALKHFDTSAVRHHDSGDCGGQVVDDAGDPVEGALVYGDQLHRTGSDGTFADCADVIVAVLGDAAGVHVEHAIRNLRGKRSAWRIPLVAGQRARCRLDDAEPVYCDQVPRHPSPYHETTYVGRDDDGVFQLTRVEALFGQTRPHSRWIQRFKGMPVGRASSPFGDLCAVEGWWRPCTGDRRLSVRDVEGEPTFGVFEQTASRIDGTLMLDPRVAELTPAEPHPIDVRRRKVTMLPSRDAVDPRPLPDLREWQELDFEARARQVVEAFAERRRFRMEDIEIEAFVGGAYVNAGGREGVIAFADANTAVLSPRLLFGDVYVVQLEAQP